MSPQLAMARAEGASFVVGPLLKNDVAAMAAAGTQGVPMLALNALLGLGTALAPVFIALFVGLLLALRVLDENIWKAIKAGKIGAYSVGGLASREPVPPEEIPEGGAA